MRAYGNQGLTNPSIDTNRGWRTYSRTVNITTAYTNYNVIKMLFSGTGGEMNVNGEINEVAFPYNTSSFTEISYRDWAFGSYIYPEGNTGEIRVFQKDSSNGQGPIPSYGSPFSQTVTPTLTIGTGTVTLDFYARSKDYATQHTYKVILFCTDWSRATVTFP